MIESEATSDKKFYRREMNFCEAVNETDSPHCFTSFLIGHPDSGVSQTSDDYYEAMQLCDSAAAPIAGKGSYCLDAY